jgi:hypothetical protein
MKDALGHGSNAGAHAGGTQATPKLQRRHFEQIAAELKGRGASPDEVRAVADKLATTNPGFRADFFVAAATGGKFTNAFGKLTTYRDKGPGAHPELVAKRAGKFNGGHFAGGLGKFKS